jgi:prevent-host-death family protein
VPEREPTTQTVNVTEARQNFSQLLNQVFRRQTRVIVEKSGIPVAAIISADDLEALSRFEAERERDFAIIDETRAAFQDVPDEELEREVARAVEEVRRKHREAVRRGELSA